MRVETRGEAGVTMIPYAAVVSRACPLPDDPGKLLSMALVWCRRRRAMAEQTFVRTFTFDQDKTCKEQWTFTVTPSAAGLVIDDVQIVAHMTDAGKERGCYGHPRTVAALLRGRLINSIDVDALMTASCGRDIACGQALAECLSALEAQASQ